MKNVMDAKASEGKPVLLSLQQLLDPASTAAVAPELLPTYHSIAQWMTSYLMSTHPDLGRSGVVCPFAAQALRLDTVRIAVSDATRSNIRSIKAVMHGCLRQFWLIPCTKSMKHFRTIVVGFPKLGDAQGLRDLQIVQSRLKWYCLLRGLMIGRFFADSSDPGLWHRDFRPLRSPIPLLAIREVVEHDAPFAARHPLLIPIYIWKYPLAAPQRLLNHALPKR
jgi:hypothetical protein